MEQTISFLTGLIDELSDVTWNIINVVDYKEIEEDEIIYAELENGSTFKKEDDYYIDQIQHGEDSFSGTVIYPITENKALQIWYCC